MSVVHVHPGEVVIDDFNHKHFVMPRDKDGVSSTGYIERDWSAQPLGSLVGSRTFPKELMLDEKTIREIATEKAAKKERASDFIMAKWRGGFKWYRQQYPWIHTNYCWCYAVIHACTYNLLRTGQPIPRLTPESVAAPIKNYRNNGGWGTQTIPMLVNEGIAPEADWPMGRIDRQYYEPSRANAKLYCMTEVYDLDDGETGWWQKLSLLSHNLPVPSGYSWMGHEMDSVDVVILDNGGLGCRDHDSYSNASTGEPNFRVLDSRKGRADDQLCPRVMTAA